MKISLVPMSDEMYHEYLKEYDNDIDLYFDRSKYEHYIYSEEGAARYIERKKVKKQIPMAIVHNGEIVGELIFNELLPGDSVTIGIALKNAKYKDHGYGTQAEKLAIAYAFGTLGVKTILADVILTNTRSQHVLEKVGFIETHRDEMFVYYKFQM